MFSTEKNSCVSLGSVQDQKGRWGSDWPQGRGGISRHPGGNLLSSHMDQDADNDQVSSARGGGNTHTDLA